MAQKVKKPSFFLSVPLISIGNQVEVTDDHLMPLGFPNMWTVFKVVDRVTGEPVAGPDIQVRF